MKKALILSCLALSRLLHSSETPSIQTPQIDAPQSLQNDKPFNTQTSIQFIYWKFTNPSLIYGRDGVGLTNSSPVTETSVSKTGTSFSPDYDYKPGLRVSLGFKFGPKKAFDLIAQHSWIRFDPEGSVSSSDISASFLPENWLTSNNQTTSTYQFASLKVDLNFNFAELQSGYTFGINRYFSLRPYIALLSIIADGDLKAHYAFTSSSGVPEIGRTHGKSFSWSLGPKMGLDFSYFLTKNLGIYCNANFTHQACQISMKTKQRETLPTLNQSFTIQKGRLDEVRSIAIVGLEIGPTWDEWLYDHRYHLQFRATWQTATLSGPNLSFLNNNNIDVPIGAEFRGINLRALFEF